MKRAGIAVAIVATLAIGLAWAEEPPQMKMSTEIPEGIATPDEVTWTSTTAFRLT